MGSRQTKKQVHTDKAFNKIALNTQGDELYLCNHCLYKFKIIKRKEII